ncbi:hypothetical protein [Rufibacter tibetensis]|uniref:Uncharacterized protein n=1 Tax=Rufibacter tibetensis TaxID=512763 RepID=A0A0P0CUZ2_9BACT|nr:hypothetical protein [Rufibacter tibetensis]ALI98203.1 hypothetical protein DC20_03410 [Rufibacter tibetensis]
MKEVLKVVLIIVFVIGAVPSHACECHLPNLSNWAPVVENYIDRASIIFIGKITPSKQEVVSVKIIDVFKGELRIDLTFEYRMNSSCISLPKEGLAIIYARYENDSTIEIPSCGITRSINNFYTCSIPNHSLLDGKLDFNTVDLVDKGEASSAPLLLKNWMIEYALLNAYRNNHRKVEEPQASGPYYLSYLAVALSIVAILVAFFRKQR